MKVYELIRPTQSELMYVTYLCFRLAQKLEYTVDVRFLHRFNQLTKIGSCARNESLPLLYQNLVSSKILQKIEGLCTN